MYVCSDHFNKLQRIPLFTFTFIQIEQTFSHLEKKNPLYYLKYVNLKENVNKLEFFILLRNTNKFPIIILGLRRVEYIF